MIVATVLKTGGIYDRRHVRWLESQLEDIAPLVAYTDDEELLATGPARRLAHGLPGWWSKMELFRPDLPDDIVFFDLDTIIAARPTIIGGAMERPLILRDFYRPGGLQSSVMCIPHGFKEQVWANWSQRPLDWMRLFGKDGLGDQAFLEHASFSAWGLLQDRHPGEFVSWKVDELEQRGLPSEARVIVFHGRPKPWDIPDAKQPWRHQSR